ncbi:MAG: hypothetical protein JJU12_03460 [Chlamydiales bacterium]|nr:hypothetical protein [Chlamydiales bacterium]
MWARTFELVLAIWLSISWIIFRYEGNEFLLLWNDFSCFVLMGSFSLLSYHERLRHIHLLNFLLGAWLFGFSYLIRHLGMNPLAENYMSVALLLLILSIIPTHTHRPPIQWILFMVKTHLTQK